jgi:phospholipid/cholesterol/gamma-HCH transport system permease protein
MSAPPVFGAEPPPRSRVLRVLQRPAQLPLIDTAGEYAVFVLRAFAGFRNLPKFAAEVLRQIGLLVASSALVIIFICFIVGTACGIAAESVGQAIGASITGPIFSSYCVNREIVPFLFGFILAAKVGGGIVAQLGAMRVNQEVDAMEIIGIPSMTFMVSTRMLASMIVLPILYLVALGAAEGASWIGSYVRSHTVSQGTWEFVYYTVTNINDIFYSLIKGLVISAAVVTVALYFGYRVRGGPVEVGTATARSMAVNLILVTVLNLTMTFLFWGFNPRLPIA